MRRKRETVSFISRDKYRLDVLDAYMHSHTSHEIVSAIGWDIYRGFSEANYCAFAHYSTNDAPHRRLGCAKVHFENEGIIRIELFAYSKFSTGSTSWSAFVQEAMSDVEELLKYCRSVGIIE